MFSPQENPSDNGPLGVGLLGVGPLGVGPLGVGPLGFVGPLGVGPLAPGRPGIASWGSLSSGRACVEAPGRRWDRCLSRYSFAVTPGEARCPACPTPAHNAAPPSLHEVRTAVPAFRPLLGAAISATISPHPFPSLGDSTGVTAVFPRPRSRAWIFLDWCAGTSGQLAQRRSLVSQVPRGPRDHSPCSSTPVSPGRLSRHGSLPCAAPATDQTMAHGKDISRLHHTASDLPVYASRGSYPPPADSLPAGPALPAGWAPAVPYERSSLRLSSLPELLARRPMISTTACANKTTKAPKSV